MTDWIKKYTEIHENAVTLFKENELRPWQCILCKRPNRAHNPTCLQCGKKNLAETATRLNRLIGFGPVMPNSSQVVDVDSKGNYIRDEAAWGEYMLHMAKAQRLLEDKFGVKAKNNAISGDLADLAKQLGAGNSAEND